MLNYSTHFTAYFTTHQLYALAGLLSSIVNLYGTTPLLRHLGMLPTVVVCPGAMLVSATVMLIYPGAYLILASLTLSYTLDYLLFMILSYLFFSSTQGCTRPSAGG